MSGLEYNSRSGRQEFGVGLWHVRRLASSSGLVEAQAARSGQLRTAPEAVDDCPLRTGNSAAQIKPGSSQASLVRHDLLKPTEGSGHSYMSKLLAWKMQLNASSKLAEAGRL